MANFAILPTLTGVDKGIIVNQGLKLELFKGDTIQFNGKTAKVSYFKRGEPNLLMYEIDDGRVFAATPEELAMVQKVGGRKSRKSRKSRKTRRYRRV